MCVHISHRHFNTDECAYILSSYSLYNDFHVLARNLRCSTRGSFSVAQVKIVCRIHTHIV